jgi:Fe-S-cluster containining protein
MPPRQSQQPHLTPPASAVPAANSKATSVRVAVQTVEGALGSKLSLSCPDRLTTVPLAQVLSTLRTITNGIVDRAADRERRTGRQISCKSGCGACCRQVVPLSQTEAQELPELISSLEPDHRKRVTARFEAAIARLEASGLLSRLEKHATLSREEFDALVSEYFGLGIACPFLEEESCSIHPVRPLICRQYLVTSDPVNCTNPSKQSISRVPIAADVLQALTSIERADTGARAWIPLVLAPVAQTVKSDTQRTVPDWLALLISQIEKARLQPVEIAAGSGT